jgi:hypothetical protein
MLLFEDTRWVKEKDSWRVSMESIGELVWYGVAGSHLEVEDESDREQNTTLYTCTLAVSIKMHGPQNVRIYH